jgi:hypothetical protein
MMKMGLLAGALVVLAVLLGPAGCGDEGGGGGGGAASVSGTQGQAGDAAMTEVKKHWTKNADGWITARNEGSNYAPVEFLREVKDIVLDHVESLDLSDADKMNGMEWAGNVYFKKEPLREVGEMGFIMGDGVGMQVQRVKGRWSQWVDHTPEWVQVQKVKGKWEVHLDTWLLHGTIPTPQDYTKAGIKP